MKRKTTTKLSTPGVTRKSTVTAKTSGQLKGRAERKSTTKGKANQARNLSLHDYMAIHFQTASKAAAPEKKPDATIRASAKKLKLTASSFIQKQVLEAHPSAQALSLNPKASKSAVKTLSLNASLNASLAQGDGARKLSLRPMAQNPSQASLKPG